MDIDITCIELEAQGMFAIALPLNRPKQAGFLLAERARVDVTGPQGALYVSIFVNFPHFNIEITRPESNVLVALNWSDIQFPGAESHHEVGVPGNLDNGAKILFGSVYVNLGGRTINFGMDIDICQKYCVVQPVMCFSNKETAAGSDVNPAEVRIAVFLKFLPLCTAWRSPDSACWYLVLH